MKLNPKAVEKIHKYFHEGLFSGFFNGYAMMDELILQNHFTTVVIDEMDKKCHFLCTKYKIENIKEELNLILLALHETGFIFNDSSLDPPNYSVEGDTENYKALVDLIKRIKPFRFNNEPLEDGFVDSFKDSEFEVEEIVFKLKGKINLRIRANDVKHELMYRLKTSKLQYFDRFYLSHKDISVEKKYIAKCLQNLIVGETQYSINSVFKTSNEICRIIYDLFCASGFISPENISSYDADYIRKFLST